METAGQDNMTTSPTIKKPFKVVTGDIVGEFDPKKFGPCGKSVCILHEGAWMTICQFRTKATKGSSYDSHQWKKLIKVADLSKTSLGSLVEKGVLKNTPWVGSLVDKGFLKQCAKDCSCPKCLLSVEHLKKSRKSSGGDGGRSNSSSGNSSKENQMAPLNVTTTAVTPGGGGGSVEKESGRDNDSDSGISNVSSNKADKRQKKTPSPKIPSQPQSFPPSPPPLKSPAKFTSEQLTRMETPTLPDYPFMVREAIVSVTSAGTATSQSGCSRLCILLYILNKYQPQEEVKIVNEKIKGALRLLSRMSVIDTKDGVEEDEEEDEHCEAALTVSSAIIKNLSEDVEMKDPPQLTVRPAQTSTKSSTKPKSSTKSKQDQVTGKPKAVKHKPNRDVSEDSEIKFRPSAFYPQQPVQKGTLHSPLINSEDAAAAASAVKSPKSVPSSPGSQKAKPGPRPKLSLKNINKENKNEKTVKVKKPAGMSVAKENRDKVKSVKKVKNVVKKLAKGGEGKVKKVKRLGPDGKPLAKVPGAGLNKKPLKLSPILQAICGGKLELTRNEAVAQVWTYIKAKSLQDSEDKKQINCDAKMKALTKKTTIKSHEIFSALTENMAQKA